RRPSPPSAARSAGLPVPGDTQLGEAAEERHRPPVQILDRRDEPQPGQAANERREGDFGLETRERGAEAEVAAASEAEMPAVGRPRHVERVGRRESLRSRFAAPSTTITGSPRFIVLPPSVVSVAAQRVSVRSTGPSYRTSSSTAPGTSAGS